MAKFHDAYQTGASQNLSYSTSGGSAVSTTGFTNQTYWVQLCAAGAFTSTGGVRVAIGKAPAATSTSMLLPFNAAKVYRVGLGEQISAISNDGVAGTLNVTELN
jgi:hypothetical protein